jgi:hypothetical protein
MKQIPWFKFCPANWMMGRISRQPAEVQVAFIRLCCVYWNAECDMTVNHAKLEIEESFDYLLKAQLIECNEHSVFIKFLDLQWEEASLHRSKMSEAGRRSAERRSTKVEPMLNIPLTKVKPVFNREEKRREDIEKNTCVIFEQFWTAYPRKTSKQSASKAFAKLKHEDQQKAISNIARLYTDTPLQYIPHAATYLNQARWEDQVIPREQHKYTNITKPTSDESDNLPHYR